MIEIWFYYFFMVLPH